MNETELRKLNDEMVGAYMDQNTDIILSHCSEDVLMHDSGQSRSGARTPAATTW